MAILYGHLIGAFYLVPVHISNPEVIVLLQWQLQNSGTAFLSPSDLQNMWSVCKQHFHVS